MKLRLIIIALLISIFSNAQVTKNVSEYWQLALDHPRFVSTLDLLPELLCNGLVLYERKTIWDPDSLTFKGEPLMLIDTSQSCAGLSLSAKKSWLGHYNIRLHFRQVLPKAEEGGCIRARFLSLEAKGYSFFGRRKIRSVKVKGGMSYMYVL